MRVMLVDAKIHRILALLQSAKRRLEIAQARHGSANSADLAVIGRIRRALGEDATRASDDPIANISRAAADSSSAGPTRRPVATSLIAAAETTVRVDDADLHRIYELSEEQKRIDSPRFLRCLYVYLVACYLTAPVFLLTTGNFVAAVIAPVLIPIVGFAVIGTDDGFGRAMAIAYLFLFLVPFALLLPSAVGIVQNIRYREWSRWPYVTLAILYPVMIAWVWWMSRMRGPWH